MSEKGKKGESTKVVRRSNGKKGKNIGLIKEKYNNLHVQVLKVAEEASTVSVPLAATLT